MSSVAILKRGPADWAKNLSLATLGIEMGASLVVGMGIGWWLDRVFDTAPWLISIFTGFGIVAGFRSILRVAREQAKQNDEGGPGDGSAGGR